MTNIKLILALLLLMLMHCKSYAYEYDPLLLRAQAALFPKIVLLDKDVREKLKSNSLEILVLHVENDLINAELTKALIEEKYRKTNKNALSIKLVKYSDFKDSMIATAYFLLKGTDDSVKMVSNFAEKNNRVTFSYDYNDFDSNALLSVIMRERTYIYLNKKSVQKYNIKFIPLFYKIVKVVE